MFIRAFDRIRRNFHARHFASFPSRYAPLPSHRRAASLALPGLVLGLVLSGQALAQTNTDFNVTVNTGPLDSATVYPGEPTSLRITLSNNATASALTNVGYSKPLPTNPINGLLVNGPSTISGDAGCVGGTLSTTVGQPGISLSGLTVPARQVGVAGSGECYLNIPVVAYSTDGNSTSLSYSVNAGEVSSNQGTNATGGPQAITVRAVQRPTWSKNFFSGNTANNVLVIGGATRTLRITVTNPDPNVTLTGVGFTDVFPTSAGAIMEPTGAPATGTCGGTVVLTQGAAAQVAVSNVSLAPGASCTVNVTVRGRQNNGVYNRSATNTILATGATGFRSEQGLRPAANATRTVQVRSPLAVSKSFAPAIVASGQANIFRITLTNNGSVALPVTGFTDDPIAAAPYQDRLNIAATSDITNTCPGGGANTALLNGGQGFSVAGFSIPANGNCVITVSYTAQTPGSDTPTTYTNNIPEGAVQTSVAGIVSQPQSATVLVADRLRVLKSGSPAIVSPGDPVRYDVTVQNYSTSAITNVSVADVLQNGSTLLLGGSYSPTLSAGCGTLGLNGAVQGASSVTFTIPNVPARAALSNTPGSCTISFSAMLGTGVTTSTNNQLGAGTVCYTSGPSQICNNIASPPVTTDPVETIRLEKLFDNQDAVSKREGTPTRLRLEIYNYSVQALTSLTFSDTLPSAGPFQQLRVASPANIANTCGGTVVAVAGTTSVSLNGGTVSLYDGSSPGSCALEVDVVGPAGAYINSADASAVRHNADGTTTPVFYTDGASVTYTGALQVGKNFSPTSVGPNGRSTVSVRLTNQDPARPITNIALTDDLPPGMVVGNPDNSYSTCQGNPQVTASPGATSVSLSGADLAPLGICELRFDVSVTGTANWVNTIPAGRVTAAGGITNRNAVSATLLYAAPEIPLISKSINPGTIVPGQSALLTINLTNGTQNLSNLEIADYFTQDGLPGGVKNGMRIAAAPEASTNCPNGVVAALPDGDSVRLSGASMLANTQCQVQVRVTSTTVGTLTNTIPLNSIVTDQGATNSSSFAQSTLSTTSSIGVSKRFQPAVVSPTQPARLRITIYNTQPASLTGLSLQDDFPAGLVSAPVPNPYSSCGGAVVSYPTNASVLISGGSIGPAQGNEASVCYVETDVVAADEGTYINSIPANSLRANGTPITHPPTEGKLEVRKRLIVNKAFDNLTLDADDPVGFTTGVAARLPGVPAPMTIRIENPNTVALTQVNFIDALPEGLVLALAPALSTTCTGGQVSGVASGRDVRLTGASLAASGTAGAVCTVTANVVSNIPGIYTNEIPAGDVRSFEGVNNDPRTQAQLIIATPPRITKDIAPPVIAPNAIATLTIVIENNNALQTSLQAPLVDNLPAFPDQMVVATPSVVSTTCPGGNGIVSAPAGASSVTVATGAVIPAGGCVVTARVTAATPGDYLNHIPVGALRTTFGVNYDPAEAPLKVSTRGYIAGRVFRDNQVVPNGLYIPGNSTPIAGNTIELRDGANCGGTLLRTLVTGSDGKYLFNDLSAGTYSVCQPTQPPATFNSYTVAGTIVPSAGSTGTPGTASNPPGGNPTSQVTAIVLNNNGNANEVSGSPENNFSEVLPVSIAGNVYHDADLNGVFDTGESGIGGVTVSLSGPVTADTVTAADGSYSFSNLPPGTYTLVETQPSPWVDAEESVGTVDGIPRGTASANDTISAITLAAGDDGIEYNFGESAPIIALPVSVAGNVYYDADLDGVFDSNESGIGGVTVSLSGPVTADTVTAADGSYSFSNLPPGTYTLVETQPSPWTDAQESVGTVNGTPRGTASANDTISGIALASGEDGIEYNFGESLADLALTVDANAYCERDVPRVAYDLPALAGIPPGNLPPITIGWYTVGGQLVSELLAQPVSGVLLWPGAEVDGSDTGVAWPGWAFEDGQWVEVPDDRVPEMVLRVTVNPTAEVTLQYPPSTPTCRTQPPQDEPPPPQPIPSTPQGLLWLLTLLLGVTGYWRLRRRY